MLCIPFVFTTLQHAHTICYTQWVLPKGKKYLNDIIIMAWQTVTLLAPEDSVLLELSPWAVPSHREHELALGLATVILASMTQAEA